LPSRATEHFPLGAGRVGRLGWSIFRFSWRSIFGALAVCLVPAYLIRCAVDATVGNPIYEWFSQAGRATQLGLPQPPRPPDFEIALLAIALATMVQFVASLVATAAVVAITDRVYRGAALGARASVRLALERVLSLVGAQLLMFVAVLVVLMIGVLLAATFFLGGGPLVFVGLVVLVGVVATILFITVRSTLMSVTIIVDGVGGPEGFRRSWRLVADHGWRVLGYLVLVGLAEVLVTVVVAGLPVALTPLPPNSTAQATFTTAIYGVAAILAAPVAPIVLTLIYYDLRWRHGETVPAPGGGEVAGLAQPERR